MTSKTKWIQLGIVGVIVVLAGYGMLRSRSASDSPETGTSPMHQDLHPLPGKVTMIDLGATECLPCKMMAPIIEELQKEYEGRAEILFIDVWKNPDQAKKYGIRAIPTQIFFDQTGREVLRNTGFMDKKRITGILSDLGVS